MKQKSKRFKTLSAFIQKGKPYPISEALTLTKKTSRTRFEGSVEAHFRLGIDVKKGDQSIRGIVQLPHGSGKTKIIAAFVPEGKEKEAKEAGADIVGGQELINTIKQNERIEFDIAVATPEMMPKLAAIARILGPKGLMPSPKNETITSDLKKTIQELKRGKMTFKNDDSGNVHMVIGKTSFDGKQLLENYQVLLGALKKAKPAGAKGIFIQNITINATMGPGIRVEI